jgi:hypothetical protein
MLKERNRPKPSLEQYSHHPKNSTSLPHCSITISLPCRIKIQEVLDHPDLVGEGTSKSVFVLSLERLCKDFACVVM